MEGTQVEDSLWHLELEELPVVLSFRKTLNACCWGELIWIRLGQATEAVECATIVEEAKRCGELGFTKLGETLPDILSNDVSLAMPCGFLIVDTASSDEDLSVIGVDGNAEGSSCDPHACLFNQLTINKFFGLFQRVSAIDILSTTDHENTSSWQGDDSVHEVISQVGTFLSATEIQILIWDTPGDSHGLILDEGLVSTISDLERRAWDWDT